MSGQRTYILSDPDGGWWLYPHAADSYNGVPTFDGEPRKWREWQHFDTLPTRFERVRPGGFDVTGYRLIEGMTPTDTYPATLTPEERRQRLDDDYSHYDARVETLYEAVRVERPEVVEPLDLPTVELIGRPAGAIPDGLTWHGSLPSELRHHPEYVHLFPGELRGTEKAIKELCQTLGADAHDYTGKWKVNKVLTIPGKTYTVKEGRRRIEKPATLGVSVVLAKPPYAIRGADLDEAVGAWQQIVDTYTRALTALQGVTACPTCETTGVVAS